LQIVYLSGNISQRNVAYCLKGQHCFSQPAVAIVSKQHLQEQFIVLPERRRALGSTF